MQTTMIEKKDSFAFFTPKEQRFKGKRKNNTNLHLRTDETSSGEFAKVLALSYVVVSVALSHKSAPAPIRLQGKVRVYKKSKLVAWLEAHSQSHEGQIKFLRYLYNEKRTEHRKRKAEYCGY